jgi:hypothetical protein
MTAMNRADAPTNTQASSVQFCMGKATAKPERGHKSHNTAHTLAHCHTTPAVACTLAQRVFVYQDAIRGESKLTFDAGLASGASPSLIAEPPDQMPSTPTQVTLSAQNPIFDASAKRGSTAQH